jgi:hypothetical protein
VDIKLFWVMPLTNALRFMEKIDKFKSTFTLDTLVGKSFLVVPKIEGEEAHAIELDSQVAKSYVGFCEIHDDLEHVKNILSILDKNIEHEYSSKINQSFYHEIIMTYSKCFRSAEKRRRIKLDKNWIVGIRSDLRKHHDYLISVTDSHIAHAGDSNHFKSKVYLIWPKKITNPLQYSLRYVQGKVNSRNDIEFISLTNDLIDFLLLKTGEKRKQIEEKLCEEVNSKETLHWNERAKKLYPLEF